MSLFVLACLCVYVSALRLLITSGMMLHDMEPIWLVKQVLHMYMATVVVIVNGHGLGIGMRRTH